MSDTKDTSRGFGISKTIFKEWLEKLQQESWQLELIISGFVLYGIYNSKDVIVDLHNYNLEGENNVFLEALESLVSIGWRIFFINLLLHVILRSLWIGAIGLRYVSGEINFDELNYSKYFTKYLKKRVGEYDDFIERLEKICSVLFSYTFLLFLFFVSALSFGIFSIIPLIIVDALGADVQQNIIYFLLWFLPFVVGGAIVFIDFVTLGGIKRIDDRTVSKIYMPIYWFYSHITLAFLYRPLLYNFIDDKYTRKLFFFSFPYIFVIANCNNLYTNVKTPYLPDNISLIEQGLIVDPYYYDDLYNQELSSIEPSELNEHKRLGPLRLSQYKVTDAYLQLFVKYNRRFQKSLEGQHDVSSIYKSGWHFTLFSDIEKERDSVFIALKDSLKVDERIVYEEYKIYRDSIKRINKDSSLIERLILTRDSLKHLRNQLNNKKRSQLKAYELEKAKKILDLSKNQLKLKIDGIDYNDSLNYYFNKHYLLGHEGILYNIPMEHLAKGSHMLDIELSRNYNEEQDSLITRIYRLPILKM